MIIGYLKVHLVSDKSMNSKALSFGQSIKKASKLKKFVQIMGPMERLEI